MFSCRACGHDDMVHRNFSGCCGHQGCPCKGMDGNNRCESHGDACWWAVPRTPATPENIRVELRRHGNGYVYFVFIDNSHVKTLRTAKKTRDWVLSQHGVEIPMPPPKTVPALEL